MKKNNGFMRLYKESLRQTRVVGIIFIVILSLFAFVVPFGQYLDFKIDLRQGMSVTANVIYFDEINTLFPILMFVLAPLCALMSFSYLNKRASSDFYHSATQTRSVMFASSYLSALTWLLLTAIISTAIGLIVPLFCDDCFIINWHSFIDLAKDLVGAIYVLSATTLAMTLTGTLINNILVTGIIIFVPRLLLTIIASAVQNSASVIPDISELGLLDYRYNIVFAKTTEIFNGSVENNYAIIYTGILAVIYAAVAFIAFRLRPSETAGRSAPNRLLQCVYRVLVTMVVCTVGCMGIFAWATGNTYEDDSVMLFQIILIYVAALIVWVVYELITTRRAINVIKTLPSLGIVLFLNVAIILTMNCINASVLSFRPEPEEIKYIKLENNHNYYGQRSYSLNEYLIGDSADIKITDPKTIEIVSDSLIKTINDSYSPIEELNWEKIVIATEKGETTRRILIPYNDCTYIETTLNTFIVEKNKFKIPPEFNNNKISTISAYNIDSEELEVLYNTLIDELKSMSNDEIKEYIMYADSTPSFGGFDIYTYEGLDKVNIYIYFSELLEKTSEKYLEFASNDPEDKKIIELLDDDDITYSDISINVFDVENSGFTHFWYGSFKNLEELGMTEHIKNNFGKPIDLNKPFAEISYGYAEKEGEYYSAEFYVSLDGIKIPEEMKNGYED